MPTKPLFHISLPDSTDSDHFAPLQIALEGLTAINEWHIERALKRSQRGQGQPIPPLYASGVRYKEDPPGEENWCDVLECLKQGHADCLPLSTLVMRDDYELVPLGSLKPGDRIMGDGKWTEVREIVVTGEKEILSFKLSNGCALRCSPEHRLFRDVDGTIEEVRAKDVRIGDDLVTPRSIPFAEVEGAAWPASLAALSIEDRNWLLGVFVADGWTQGSRCGISGQDGKPKEEQKRRIETLMRSCGVSTYWNRKYIAINDREVTAFFEQCGHLARGKRLPSLRFTSEIAVRAALDGLAADASLERREGKTPGIVYGTTSPALVLQLRALYRMLGTSVSIRRVEDHGGFGERAVYRILPRLSITPGSSERRDKKFARVREISDGGDEVCGDIETDTGKFWLPESDVLVHNCDRLAAWRTAECRVFAKMFNRPDFWAEPVLKWQWIPTEIMVAKGYPRAKLPPDGVWLVHCLVRFRDGRVEDPSKILGMGGEYMENI